MKARSIKKRLLIEPPNDSFRILSNQTVKNSDIYTFYSFSNKKIIYEWKQAYNWSGCMVTNGRYNVPDGFYIFCRKIKNNS
jgi:hypothetical protein